MEVEEEKGQKPRAKQDASSLSLFTPKVQTGNHVLTGLVFVCVQDLQFAKGKQVFGVTMIIILMGRSTQDMRSTQGLGSGGSRT